MFINRKAIIHTINALYKLANACLQFTLIVYMHKCSISLYHVCKVPCKIVSHFQMAMLYALQFIFTCCIVHESVLSNIVLVLYVFISTQCVEFPSHWEGHSEGEEWKIVPVSPRSAKFKQIAARFTSTMPYATIERVERVQNRVLWARYHDCKERLERDLPSAGEKHLFHGTRQTDPKDIYSGDAGFDVGHSRGGMWGVGNYFAVNASYSRHYAHTKNVLGYSVPLSKMLVAKVLTGLAFVSPPRSELRFPPERADTGAREGRVRHRYNSVQGTTGGSEVYITYSNEQAYPAYVISYTQQQGRRH